MRQEWKIMKLHGIEVFGEEHHSPSFKQRKRDVIDRIK